MSSLSRAEASSRPMDTVSAVSTAPKEGNQSPILETLQDGFSKSTNKPTDLSGPRPRMPELNPLGGPGGRGKKIGEAEFEPQSRLVDEIKNDQTFQKLTSSDTWADGLKRLNPELVTKHKGDSGFIHRYNVLGDQIGLGSKHGQPKFYPPGNYFWIGIGRNFTGAVPIQDPNKQFMVIRHLGVTLVDLHEGYFGVVQKGDEQFVIGPGRYCMQGATSLEGEPIDIKNLPEVEKVKIYSEEPVEVPDAKDAKHRLQLETRLVEKEVVAGRYAKVGAVIFARPEPGFRCITRTADAKYHISSGLRIARGTEAFIGFVDTHDYSRTTKQFRFLSKDSQSVEMTIQLSWRLIDGTKWRERHGAYADIFDALEEKAQALFRDAVGALTHEETLATRGEGWAPLETNVRPELEQRAAELGGELLDVQIRELKFPLVQMREQELADKEATAKQQLLETKRETELQTHKNKQRAEQQAAELERKLQEAQKNVEIERITHQKTLTQVQAKAEQEEAEVVAKAKREQARLGGERDAAKIAAEKEMLLAQAAAEAKLLTAQKDGEAEVAKAGAMAKAHLMKKQAEASGELEMAKAKAEGAKMLGEALRSNPQAHELEMARLEADVKKAQAQAISEAIKANPHAFLREDLYREFIRMDMGHQPEYPQIMLASTTVPTPSKKDPSVNTTQNDKR